MKARRHTHIRRPFAVAASLFFSIPACRFKKKHYLAPDLKQTGQKNDFEHEKYQRRRRTPPLSPLRM
jgi:hypothetical protein